MEREQHEVKVIKKFLKDISRRSDLGGRAFIELDDTAVSEGVCLISADATGDEFAENPALSFRCGFDSAFAALSALQSGVKEPRQHRNDAVRCGGIWEADVLQNLDSRRSGIDVASLPQAPEEEPDRKGKWPHFPVFRTADISTETLNKFITEVYDYEHDDDENPCVAFVTRHDKKSFTQEGACKVGTVLDQAPRLSEALKHATPEECRQLIRRRMYAQWEMDTDYFIIMDHITETQKTVIVASQSEIQNEGELNLIRCEFREVMVILMAVYATGLCFEAMADSAAQERDGISRQNLDEDDEESDDGTGSDGDEWEDDD